jgi:hypothetical protein
MIIYLDLATFAQAILGSLALMMFFVTIIHSALKDNEYYGDYNQIILFITFALILTTGAFGTNNILLILIAVAVVQFKYPKNKLGCLCYLLSISAIIITMFLLDCFVIFEILGKLYLHVQQSEAPTELHLRMS